MCTQVVHVGKSRHIRCIEMWATYRNKLVKIILSYCWRSGININRETTNKSPRNNIVFGKPNSTSSKTRIFRKMKQIIFRNLSGGIGNIPRWINQNKDTRKYYTKILESKASSIGNETKIKWELEKMGVLELSQAELNCIFT